MNGSPVHDEPVVIVEVDSGNVSLRTGRISSISSEANTRNEAVVRASCPFHPAMDSADDGYEKCFSVDSIHLLKEQEAQLLQDPGNAQKWFGCIYQDWIVERIFRALNRDQDRVHDTVDLPG